MTGTSKPLRSALPGTEVDRFNARVIDVSAPHLARGYDLKPPGDSEIVAIE
jgi:hypothetical protein